MEDYNQPGDNSKQTDEERIIKLESLKALYFSQFPTDEHCWAELFRMSSPDQKMCSDCGSENLSLVDDGRQIKCHDCDGEKRLTAGTFFHRVRAIRAWFGAIWLMERGAIFSANWLHKTFDIAYSTAWMIHKKLSMVLLQSIPKNVSELHSSLFAALFGRRSRETPAREHPSAEQSELENQADRGFAYERHDGQRERTASNDEDEVNKSKSQTVEPGHTPQAEANAQETRAARAGADIDALLDALNEWKGSHVDKEETLEEKVLTLLSKKNAHSEELLDRTAAPLGDLSSVLVMLEIQGLIERLPGDFYQRKPQVEEHSSLRTGSLDNSLRKENIVALNDFKQLVELVFHRISRKYLQLFIYKYWCLLDRTRWGEGALFEACLEREFIEDNEVLAFVSPLIVRFPLLHPV